MAAHFVSCLLVWYFALGLADARAAAAKKMLAITHVKLIGHFKVISALGTIDIATGKVHVDMKHSWIQQNCASRDGLAASSNSFHLRENGITTFFMPNGTGPAQGPCQTVAWTRLSVPDDGLAPNVTAGKNANIPGNFGVAALDDPSKVFGYALGKPDPSNPHNGHFALIQMDAVAGTATPPTNIDPTLYSTLGCTAEVDATGKHLFLVGGVANNSQFQPKVTPVVIVVPLTGAAVGHGAIRAQLLNGSLCMNRAPKCPRKEQIVFRDVMRDAATGQLWGLASNYANYGNQTWFTFCPLHVTPGLNNTGRTTYKWGECVCKIPMMKVCARESCVCGAFFVVVNSQ